MTFYKLIFDGFWLFFLKFLDQINRFGQTKAGFIMIWAKFKQNIFQKYVWVVGPVELSSNFLIACSKFAPESFHQIAWFQS